MKLAPLPFSLRQLQYALAVSETLSFRRAAEKCRVAQPSLSAQIAQLEDALGVQLFERDKRRVLVTQAGRQILERAQRLLNEAEDLATTARQVGDPLSGSLRIGVIPTISPYLLPSVTPALRAAYPRLSLHWMEEKTPFLVRALAAGDVDAAIVALEADLGDVDSEVIAEDAFLLATPPGHPLGTAKGPARASELRQAPVLLLDEGHCLREQALSLCNVVRAEEAEFRATSLTTLAQMVAGGAGITLLPEIAAPTEADRAGLRLRRFEAPAPSRTIALVWRKRSALAPALKKLAATLRQAYPRTRPPRSQARQRN
ncbi:MAG: LysR family transcriptional regulator [Polyangiaceae bacterium]|nr:LysR family transcriptional regulator [Polyangiaceae bacterium]